MSVQISKLRAALAASQERVKAMEQLLIENVAEIHKAGEKIIQECFQYRREDAGLECEVILGQPVNGLE